MYMLISSGPLTARKLSAHSVATAFARRVLPVPAGAKMGLTNTDLNAKAYSIQDVGPLTPGQVHLHSDKC